MKKEGIVHDKAGFDEQQNGWHDVRDVHHVLRHAQNETGPTPSVFAFSVNA